MITERSIETRVRGSRHGFITRMVSPGDLGERLKPFVFLDHLTGHVPEGGGFGFHPHSGIATLTYQLNADVAYEDTAGQNGIVAATGLEWMRAGGGTWHRATLHPSQELTTGFQLWIALPPDAEDGPSEGIYVAPDQVPQVGHVRVLLGDYQGHTNPIPAPSPLTYLDVVLGAGESWRYQPPSTHTVGWVFVYGGRAQVCGEPVEGELVVLDESTAPIELRAEIPCRALVGTAKKHEYPLVLGSHSVHTNSASLARASTNIRAIGEDLRRAGRLR
jgi:redox-sensitive bicupin YhaK (pirin superfamily)